MNRSMMTHDVIVLALDIDDDLTKQRESAEVLALAENFANMVIISVNGYEHDEREIYQIPEVMAYLKKWYGFALAGGASFQKLDDISRALLLCAIGMAKARQMPDGSTQFETLGNL